MMAPAAAAYFTHANGTGSCFVLRRVVMQPVCGDGQRECDRSRRLQALVEDSGARAPLQTIRIA